MRLLSVVTCFFETTNKLPEPHDSFQSILNDNRDILWHAELDLFAIKQSLNLDHLRCKSPEMIRRELWTTLLAYNMVRLVCAQAAFVHDKLPRQMSFTLACNTLLSQWLMPPKESIRQTLGQYNLLQIACNEVARRPGRIEPRVVKRRPKSYKLMTKPRHQYKQANA